MLLHHVTNLEYGQQIRYKGYKYYTKFTEAGYCTIGMEEENIPTKKYTLTYFQA